MRKKLPRNGPSIECPECVQGPAFDPLNLGKAPAATARRVVQNGEISDGVPDEGHPVIVQVRHQHFRGTGRGRRRGFYENVLRVDVQAVVDLAFPSERHEFATAISIEQRSPEGAADALPGEVVEWLSSSNYSFDGG